MTESREDWHELTGGGISKAQLRRMGHPYGRGRNAAEANAGRDFARGLGGVYAGAKRGVPKSAKGKPKQSAPLTPINRQSGRLQNGLNIVKVAPGQYRLETEVEHFAYLDQGTERMVARPVAKEVALRFRARMQGVARAQRVP